MEEKARVDVSDRLLRIVSRDEYTIPVSSDFARRMAREVQRSRTRIAELEAEVARLRGLMRAAAIGADRIGHPLFAVALRASSEPNGPILASPANTITAAEGEP